jgi:hypothetical protein
MNALVGACTTLTCLNTLADLSGKPMSIAIASDFARAHLGNWKN